MKLVRDKIPVLFPGNRFRRIDDPTEVKRLIRLKLVEEVNEALAAGTSQGLAEELADVLEVVEALARLSGIPFTAVEQARVDKKIARGGFLNGWVME